MPSKYPALPALTVAMISILSVVGCHKQVAKATPPQATAPVAQQPVVAPQPAARASVAPSAPAAAAVAPDVDALFAERMQDAFFAYDKAELRADTRSTLTQDAEFLRSYSQLGIVIEGHCDDRGSEEYNLALGDRRASAAKNYLVSLGIPADRIRTTSVGKERPFCTDNNESCWQQNRRGHFERIR